MVSARQSGRKYGTFHEILVKNLVDSAVPLRIAFILLGANKRTNEQNVKSNLRYKRNSVYVIYYIYFNIYNI